MDQGFFDTVEQLLDEDDYDTVVLKNSNGVEEEFEQISLVALAEEQFYAILLPVSEIGKEEEIPLVFFINEENESFDLVTDRTILKRVFYNYYDAADKILEEFDDEE